MGDGERLGAAAARAPLGTAGGSLVITERSPRTKRKRFLVVVIFFPLKMELYLGSSVKPTETTPQRLGKAEERPAPPSSEELAL